MVERGLKLTMQVERGDPSSEAALPRAADLRQVVGLRAPANDIVEVLLARVAEPDAEPPG